MLEVPVTVQGAKSVEGAERREIFAEATKTSLVFDKGAVVNLKTKVLPGQCVFLRNEQTGREILCKVLESQQAGEVGYTDLEFTAYDPNFWNVPAEQPAAAAQKPEAQKGIEGAVKSPATTPSAESSAPVGEEIPANLPETAAPATAGPKPETTEELPEPGSEADRNDADDAKDAEQLAALIALDDKRKAKREPATEGTEEKEPEAASEDVTQQSETSADTAGEVSVPSAQASETSWKQVFPAGKKPIAIGIAASLLIAAALGITWHEIRGSSVHGSSRSSAASPASRQHTLPVTTPSSQTPASAVATGGTTTAGAGSTNTGNSNAGTGAQARGNNAGATPAQAAKLIRQPIAGQAGGVADARNPAAISADIKAAKGSKAAGGADASAAPKVDASGSGPGSDPAALGQPRHRKPSELNDGETIPAKIVSQPQPTFPSWATGLDVDGVVQLNALIDENGNVKELKPLSGPRVLQGEAEKAVALWIFEPALTDGKPTATHMVLTVEFQR